MANVYLHEVLDEWFEQQVKPCLGGRAFLVRYADDFVRGFAWEADARRVRGVWPKRSGKYGLTIHPDTTRLVRFDRPERVPPAASGSASQPESFDFLGFTHFWSRSLTGQGVVQRQTADKRFRRAVRGIAEGCRFNRHVSIREQPEALTRKLRGHDPYYGVIGNTGSLHRF